MQPGDTGPRGDSYSGQDGAGHSDIFIMLLRTAGSLRTYELLISRITIAWISTKGDSG